MKKVIGFWQFSLTALIAFAGIPRQNVMALDVIKVDNDSPLDSPYAWESGAVPGTGDTAIWNVAFQTNRTYTLDSDLAWNGLAFMANTADNLYFNGSGSITLGAGGIYSDGNFSKKATFNIPVNASADQDVSGTLIFNKPVDYGPYRISYSGNRKKQYKSSVSASGELIVTGGEVEFSKCTLPEADLTIADSGTFTVIKDVIQPGSSNLSKSVTLSGDSKLRIYGSSKADVDGYRAGPVSVTGSGTAKIVVYKSSSKYHFEQIFESLSFSPSSGALLFVSNEALASEPSGSGTNSVNVLFSEPPELLKSESGRGQLALGIIPNTMYNNNSQDYGVGLVTYDDTFGVRPLDFSSEYAHVISDGENSGHNVRISVETPPADGNTFTNILSAPLTTVNSLSLCTSGAAGHSGIVLQGTGGAALRIESGIVFVSQNITSGTRTEDDRTQINVPLDFNGKMGVIMNARTVGMSNGRGQPLTFNVSPVNDGGEGIVFNGDGSTYLQYGDALFTGPLVVNDGWVRLAGSSGDNVVASRLVINSGGSVQNHGSRIADNADIEINGGTLSQKGGDRNSGTGAWETFRNLYMTDGTYTLGADGTSSGTTYMTNAFLSGGTVKVTRGHSLNVGGNFALCGTSQLVLNNADKSYRAKMFMNGGTICITNTSDASWTPITIGYCNYEEASAPPYITLDAEDGRPAMTYDSDGRSEMPAVIDTDRTALMPGRIVVNKRQVFQINDGTNAPVDLLIAADIMRNANDEQTESQIVKTGSGTLCISGNVNLSGEDGTNGKILVEQGEVSICGTSYSPLVIGENACLSGDGKVISNVSFSDTGSFFKFDAETGASAEPLSIEGTVSGSVTVVIPEDIPIENDGRVIMRTSGNLASFTTDDPDWTIFVQNNGSEIKLARTPPTMAIIR